MADDLAALHRLAESLLDAIDGPARARLLRRMAQDIRKTQQARMARQTAPDGTPWEKRKPRVSAKPATRPVRFLYNSSGVVRLVDMRSWVKQGDRMTGFDREADGIRTFRSDRVSKWLPGLGSAEGVPKGLKGGTRRKATSMFRGLRTARHMKAGAGPEEAWVSFTSRAVRLARIHHHGLRDRVAKDGPEVDYPERPLLGFAPSDEAQILNAFIDQAGDALGWGRRAGR